jgi:hypothetical protein
MAEAARWAAAKFQALAASTKPGPGLYVLANNDPVQLNARNGRPLRIVNTSFGRGLYCHAISKVVVRLPAAGDAFTAIAGVDSNEQTSGGRGSVPGQRPLFATSQRETGAPTPLHARAGNGQGKLDLRVSHNGKGRSAGMEQRPAG